MTICRKQFKGLKDRGSGCKALYDLFAADDYPSVHYFLLKRLLALFKRYDTTQCAISNHAGRWIAGGRRTTLTNR